MTTNDQPMDHAPPERESGNGPEQATIEKHLKSQSTWLRLVFMIIFGLLYALSRIVLGAVVVVQFFCVLLTGETKSELKSFGHSLAIYSYQVVEYLTFNREKKPFPLEGAWPMSLDDA